DTNPYFSCYPTRLKREILTIPCPINTHVQTLLWSLHKILDTPAQYYLKPLYNRFSDILREQSVLHADETSYRVLESDTNLTYFW
ncbi:transposase, partial [Streptococcus danieliae]|nr:transposase [Streptococcus danieliae]